MANVPTAETADDERGVLELPVRTNRVNDAEPIYRNAQFVVRGPRILCSIGLACTIGTRKLASTGGTWAGGT